LGLFAIVGGLLVWVLMFTNVIPSLFRGPSAVIKAEFASSEAIAANDPVRIHGVDVGTVGSVSRDPGGRGVTLTLELSSNVPIYADASASVIWRTLLGANDAIAFDPGTRAAGPLGSRTIPQSHNSDQVELDEITRTLHGGAQQGTRTMLQQLGPAFSAHPALARTLSTLAQIAPAATAGIGALRGVQADSDLRALVRQVGRATQALAVGTQADETRQFVQSAANTLTSLSISQSDLQATIADAGTVLPHLTTTAAAIDHTLGHLDPLVAKLTPEASLVRPTLAALHPAVVGTETLLHDATPLLRTLRPTVSSLARTARIGVPVIQSLAPSLQRLDRTILPGLDWKSPESGGYATYQVMSSFMSNLSSFLGAYNRDGQLANLTLGLGNENAQEVLPCNIDFARGSTDLLVCTSLSTALSTAFGAGTSLLQSTLGSLGLPAPLAKHASRLTDTFAAARSALFNHSPAAARYVYEPHHGRAR
jgi:phospholipid/cholesterol/gamma-HCH transport system substrate-binding protein